MQSYWFLLVFAVMSMFSLAKGFKSGRFSFFGLEGNHHTNPKLHALIGAANVYFAVLAITGFAFAYRVGLSNAPKWLFIGYAFLFLLGAIAVVIKLFQAIRVHEYTVGSESYSRAKSPFLYPLMIALQSMVALLLFGAAFLTVWHEHFTRPA